MRLCVLLLIAVLAGCASTREPASPPEAPILASPQAAPASPAPGRGGYYKDDGPGENPPPNLAAIPDAVPRREPPNRYANRPYTVLGANYVPISTTQPYKEQGIASWYGKKFHGQKTSSGEPYDMYAMTGAHKTLPIPSYARVTNLANGRSVVVRINDRGPFHSERIIDLSYAAAYKLGYAGAGSARVEVEAILPDAESKVAAAPQPRAVPEPTPALAEVSAPAEPPSAMKSVYLQVGAFSARENAEDLRSRVVRQLAWLSERLEVLSIGNLWHLQVGPYASREAARSIAERIESELNVKPLLVSR
ncbi:MAG: septal ring lytic transglycosylase RlpA family protein [Betaproteobacteria bacterium]|nr:septal ring lytic transglycosylase RlpA family protein [Betaproteobacteria bacterium]